MEYKYKDIVTSIIPGLIYFFIIGLFCYRERISELFHSQNVDGEVKALLVPLLCICVGYIITIFGSVVEKFIRNAHFCAFRFGKILLPRPILDGETRDTNISEEWHSIKDSLSENSKVEGYFIRYSQSRNVFYSVVLAIVTLVCYKGKIIYPNFCVFDCYFGKFLFWVAVLFTLFHAYKKNYKRYYQVILAEYLRQKMSQEHQLESNQKCSHEINITDLKNKLEEIYGTEKSY